MEETQTVDECQTKCQNEDWCKIFTYVQSDKMCSLKASKEGRSTQKGAISGPRSCNGKMLK